MTFYMARNQYGATIHDLGSHPRKALLDRLGARRAAKMYIDKADGSTAHVGYVIRGDWWTIYKVEPWERAS